MEYSIIVALFRTKNIELNIHSRIQDTETYY